MNGTTPETYCDVFDRFERDDIRYAVISGVAVVLHGHVRPIADLNIVIDPRSEEAARAMRALARNGSCRAFHFP